MVMVNIKFRDDGNFGEGEVTKNVDSIHILF